MHNGGQSITGATLHPGDIILSATTTGGTYPGWHGGP